MDNEIQVNPYDKIIIFGAQVYAASTYFAWKERFLEIPVICFAVSETNGNPDEIDGIKVCDIKDLGEEFFNHIIFVATPEIYHADIIKMLKTYGFNRIVPIDYKEQSKIMIDFYTAFLKQKGREFIEINMLENRFVISESLSMNIYMAKSKNDKPLVLETELPSWIIPVQAGAVISEELICRWRDDMGTNISEKNRNYCELTVAYWLWKNRLKTEYVGLCHYRRYLEVKKEHLGALIQAGVDAVLPIPMMVYPNVYQHHKRYIQDKDWDRMMEVLQKLYPEYYEKSEEIFSNKDMYLHNLWVLSKSCAENFLNWMFSILFEIETYEIREDKRYDRHMGYLGESLTTLYFMYNKDNLCICHAVERTLA